MVPGRVLGRVPGLVSLLFWHSFPGLSPYSSGILFHHHFLVASGSGWDPGLVFLLFSCFFCPERDSVPLEFHHDFQVPSGSDKGFGGCLPTFLFFHLFSFLRKRILFRRDILFPLGSNWASGVCLFFFLVSNEKKGFRHLPPFFLFFPSFSQETGNHCILNHTTFVEIRPHRFGGEGVLIGVQSATLNAQVTFVYIAVAISALAGGGAP